MMRDEQRQLYFRVMDDVQSPQMLRYMYEISNLVRSQDVLWWLILNKITGEKFVHFVASFGGSIISAAGFILTKIHKDRERRKVLYGRDYIENQTPFNIGGKT